MQDATWHKGLYLSQFSEQGTPTTQFWNLLEVPVPKVITVVCYPVPTREAQQRVIQEVNASTSYGALQAESAGRLNAFDREQIRRSQQQEDELASTTHADISFRCYVDVLGHLRDEAELNFGLVMNSIGNTGFIPRELDYMQHLGMEAALLIGRGLNPKFMGSES